VTATTTFIQNIDRTSPIYKVKQQSATEFTEENHNPPANGIGPAWLSHTVSSKQHQTHAPLRRCPQPLHQTHA